MIVTEQQAKAKWCFAAVASHTNPRGGFDDDDGATALKIFTCIGSACMAWRVSDSGMEFVECGQTSPHKVDKDTPPPGDGWTLHNNGYLDIGWIRQSRPQSGYCGLAGQL